MLGRVGVQVIAAGHFPILCTASTNAASLEKLGFAVLAVALITKAKSKISQGNDMDWIG